MRPMTTDHSALDTPGHADAVAHHRIDDHGDDHGHDDHAHDEEPLGPIDIVAWGAGALGIGIGIVVALCFALATA
jgi:hypothetical protein